MILDLHRQGLTVSAIARELGIDRKTVRKCIARGLQPPVYGPRKPRQRVIDPFVPYPRERVMAYPGLTGRRLWRELRERGYRGGYTAVTDQLRRLRPAPLAPFEVRFETPPGAQAQVDFAQFQVVFTDESGDTHRLAVLAGARLQPPDLGALRPAPGHADGSTLSHGGVRGAGFDFSFQPSLDRNRVLALAQLDFIARNEVIHFLGPPGTGKSHLATALGVEAVKAGRSVYFASLADIVCVLATAEREGQLRQRIRFLCRASLLIVDEIGYLPVIPGGGNLFFQLVNARYERGAMILTSNRGFAEWGEVFGDPVVATALLDRLLHHAVVIQIEGSSYRLREHADLMPEHTRSKALINAPIPAQPPRRRGRPPKNGANDHAGG